MDHLAIKYHLNEIQSNQSTHYIKDIIIDKPPVKEDIEELEN